MRPHTPATGMIAATLRRAVGLAVLWLIAAEGHLAAWPLALAGIGAATAASLWLLPPARVPAISLPGLAVFVLWFMRQSLLGGLQVAALALRPRQALRPALVELPLTLPPGPPRVLFTAALGLMPGTLGVRLHGDRLWVHVLDRGQPLADEAARLAARVSAVFGAPR